MIIVRQFPDSGLGDRLMELYLLSIIGCLYKLLVHIEWPMFQIDEKTMPEWRIKDTYLEHLLSFLKLPQNLVFYEKSIPESDIKNPIELPQLFGFETSVEALYNKFFTSACSIQNIKDAANFIQPHFSLNIPQYTAAEPFVTVHLRRTDKLLGQDCFQITKDELEDLNTRTKKAILKAKEKGYKYFFLASDDKNTRLEYKSYLLENGLICLEPENIHSLIESYYDFWVMKSSALIIQSMTYSTFSLVHSVIWKTPLWTVYKDSHIFKQGFHLSSPITYYEDVE